VPVNIQSQAMDSVFQIIYPALAEGSYQLTIHAAHITDRNGDVLGSSDIVSHFRVFAFSAIWINPNGGDWSDPTNWQNGQVPGASDEVLINEGDVLITHVQGNDEIESLFSNDPFTLSGGALRVDETIQV